MNALILSQLETPQGPLRLVTDAQGRVHALDFTEGLSPARRRMGFGVAEGELRAGPAPASVAVDAVQLQGTSSEMLAELKRLRATLAQALAAA